MREIIEFHAPNWAVASSILEEYQNKYKVVGYGYNHNNGKGYVAVIKNGN